MDNQNQNDVDVTYINGTSQTYRGVEILETDGPGQAVKFVDGIDVVIIPNEGVREVRIGMSTVLGDEE